MASRAQRSDTFDVNLTCHPNPVVSPNKLIDILSSGASRDKGKA